MNAKIVAGWVLLLSWAGTPVSVQAQYSDPFLAEYLWGRQPSARAEALGRAQVALDGELASVLFNPAGIGGIEGVAGSASYASPYYGLRKARYYFAAAGMRFASNAVLALSAHHLTYGDKFVYLRDPASGATASFTPYVSNYALTLAFQAFRGVYVGASPHLLSWHYLDGKTATTAMLDLGMLATVWQRNTGTAKQSVRLGGSIYNLGYSKLTLEKHREALPVIGRMGFSYRLRALKDGLAKGVYAFGLLLLGEFQDLFNSGYHTAFRVGAEVTFLDMWVLRAGYYSETLYDYGYPAVNKDRLADLTYGLGLMVPVRRLTHGRTPLEIRLDLVSLPQVSYTRRGLDLNNFTTVTVAVNWGVRGRGR